MSAKPYLLFSSENGSLPDEFCALQAVLELTCRCDLVGYVRVEPLVELALVELEAHTVVLWHAWFDFADATGREVRDGRDAGQRAQHGQFEVKLLLGHGCRRRRGLLL